MHHRKGREAFARVRFPVGSGNFSLHHRVQNGSRAHPASHPVSTGALSLEIKRSWREADYSLPSSAEVRMRGVILPLSPVCLHGVLS
jgi:hypothetical protein